jgi:FkbM family methyltransferase
MLQALKYVLTHRLKRYVTYLFRYPAWRWQSRQPRRLTLQTQQGVFTFYSNDSGIGRYLFCFGEYESDLTTGVIDLLKANGRLTPSSILLDVGANIGTTCISVVRSQAIRQAIAIEPVPANFELLQKNIGDNQLTQQIVARQLAISTSSDSVTIELSPNLHGDHRVRMQPSTAHMQELFHEGARQTISVPAVTLDQLLTQLSVKPADISLVWIDVQGHEGHVIESGHDLFAHRPPTMIEVWRYGIERSGMSMRRFFEIISGYWSTYYLWQNGQFTKHAIAEMPKLLEVLQPSAFENILLMD